MRPVLVFVLVFLAVGVFAASFAKPFGAQTVVSKSRVAAEVALATSGTLVTALVALGCWFWLLALWVLFGPFDRLLLACGKIARFAPYPLVLLGAAVVATPSILHEVQLTLPLVGISDTPTTAILTGRGFVRWWLYCGVALGLGLSGDLLALLQTLRLEAERTDVVLLGKLRGLSMWRLRCREILWLSRRHVLASALMTLFAQALCVEVWSALLIGAVPNALIMPYPSLGPSMVLSAGGVDLGPVLPTATFLVTVALFLGFPSQRIPRGGSAAVSDDKLVVSLESGDRPLTYAFQTAPLQAALSGSHAALIIGVTGAGKTTLLNAVREWRQKAIEVPQDPYLQWPTFLPLGTARDMLISASDVDALATLRTWGFAELAGRPDDLPATMSRGEAQRINLALATARGLPTILDEPTSALDADSAGRLLPELVASLEARGGLLATHDRRVLDAAEHYRMRLLRAGPADLVWRILEVTPPQPDRPGGLSVGHEGTSPLLEAMKTGVSGSAVGFAFQMGAIHEPVPAWNIAIVVAAQHERERSVACECRGTFGAILSILAGSWVRPASWVRPFQTPGRDIDVPSGTRWELAADGPMLELAAELTFKAAGVTVLKGPSGAGKSTFLRALLRRELKLKLHKSPMIGTAGLVSQDAAHAFPPRATLREAMRTPEVEDERLETLVQKLLKVEAGSLLDDYPSRVSEGQRQRLLLGRELVRKLDLLVLDEPFAALDTLTHRQMLEEVATWKAAGGVQCTVILVTHTPDDDVACLGRLGIHCELQTLSAKRVST